MTPNLRLPASVNGDPERKAGALRARLPLALTCFVGSIVFATVAAASTPLLSWMGQAADPAASLPALSGSDGAGAALEPAAEVGGRARSPCDSCGFVESVRRLEPVGDMPVAYELTVRLRDGSIRTSRSANTARWHAGDRIMLIGGVKSAAL